MEFRLLAEFVDIIGASINPAQYPDEFFTLLSLPAYDAGQTEVSLCSTIGSNKIIIQQGDILFSKLNPRIPRIWLVPESNYRKICSTEFVPLRIKNPQLIAQEYLLWICKTPQFLEPIQSAVQSSTRSHQRVRPQLIIQQPIPLVPLLEQQSLTAHIKECMKRIDEIQLLQTEALKEADNLFEAFVESQIEPGWTWQPIFEITTEVRNGWSWKESSTGQPTQVLRLSAVRNLSLDINEVRTAGLESKQSEEFSLKKDDVFIVRGNGSKYLVGRSAISTNNHPTIVFNDLLIRLRFTPEMLPEFANFMLHSRKVREQIERSAKTAAGIWKINQTGIRSLKLPCPPISAQKEKLAALHEGLAASRQIVQHFAQNDTKALSAAILRKAFAGEL